MAEFFLSTAAERDLDEIHAYISRENPEAADTVLDSAHESFLKLAHNPKLGRLRTFKELELHGLRSWRVGKFRNYLIFYRPLPINGGVEIVRVFHGTQDLESLLSEE